MTDIMLKISFAVMPIAGVAAGQLIQNHTIDIASLCVVASVVLPATWWLSRKFESIERDLNELKHNVKKISCDEDKSEVRLDELEKLK